MPRNRYYYAYLLGKSNRIIKTVRLLIESASEDRKAMKNILLVVLGIGMGIIISQHSYFDLGALNDSVNSSSHKKRPEMINRDFRKMALHALNSDVVFFKTLHENTLTETPVSASDYSWVANAVEIFPELSGIAQKLLDEPSEENLLVIYETVYNLADAELRDFEYKEIKVEREKLATAIK